MTEPKEVAKWDLLHGELVREADGHLVWAADYDALAAKMKVAVDALELLSDYENLDAPDGFYDAGATILSYEARKRYGDFDEIARATLAKLKGQTNDQR